MHNIKILRIVKKQEKILDWDVLHSYDLIRDDNGKPFNICLSKSVLANDFSAEQALQYLGELQEKLHYNYGNITNLMEVYDWICEAENL